MKRFEFFVDREALRARQGLARLAAVVVMGAALFGAGCYSPAELRAKAEQMPDPRQKDVDLMWSAIKEVVDEEGWPVEIDSRQDLVLSTAWSNEEPEGRRKRVRFLVLIAPMGMAVNCTVKYERRADNDAKSWEPDEAEATLQSARDEEATLVQAVYARYKDKR